MWVILGLVSSFFLGFYDVSKKWSLNGNAVIPLLFFATLSGFMVFTPGLILSGMNPNWDRFWHIPPQTWSAHLHFMLKSVIVGTSWIMAYFALIKPAHHHRNSNPSIQSFVDIGWRCFVIQ